MSQKNDGGPAFPCELHNEGVPMEMPGMSLRDYFAAKAMQGLIACGDEGAGDRLEEVPKYAYQIADAMLAARTK